MSSVFTTLFVNSYGSHSNEFFFQSIFESCPFSAFSIQLQQKLVNFVSERCFVLQCNNNGLNVKHLFKTLDVSVTKLRNFYLPTPLSNTLGTHVTEMF